MNLLFHMKSGKVIRIDNVQGTFSEYMQRNAGATWMTFTESAATKKPISIRMAEVEYIEEV